MEERIVVADPVADPQGYQRELLALLGGQDPVAVLAATPRAVREQVVGLPEVSSAGGLTPTRSGRAPSWRRTRIGSSATTRMPGRPSRGPGTRPKPTRRVSVSMRSAVRSASAC